MNCNEARKYLLAFADGQIGVQANCEVLDHLKMCAACSAIVDEHQALRDALIASAERTAIPVGLEARVRKAIAADRPVKHRPATMALWQNRAVRAIAMAACIVLAVSIVSQFDSVRETLNVFGDNGRARAEDPRTTVSSVIVAHNKCSEQCESQTHHADGLPTEPVLVASAICDQVGGIATLAPDLSAYGYEFESANFCSPTGRETVSGHVMYVNHDFGTRISFFSIPRWNEIDPFVASENPTRDDPFVQMWPGCTNNLTVLAWHDDDTTYICCGPMDAEDMRRMINEVVE